MLQRAVEQTLDESCIPRERVQQRIVKQSDDLAQELGALLNQQAVIEDLIASLERQAEKNKKVAERQLPDLMPLLKNQSTGIEEQLVLLAKPAKALSYRS